MIRHSLLVAAAALFVAAGFTVSVTVALVVAGLCLVAGWVLTIETVTDAKDDD